MHIYRRKGSRFWSYSFLYEGKRVWGSTGTPDKKAAEMVYVRKRKEYTERREKGELEPIGLRDLLGAYLREYAIPNKANPRREEFTVKRLLGFFEDRSASQITPRLIEQFKAHRKQQQIGGRPLAGSTINRDLAALKCAFSKGMEWGLVKENPVKAVKFYGERDRARTRYLSSEEKKRLLSVCSTELRRVVLFALKTGMRKGEILNLRWTDIDLTANRIKVGKSKSGRSRFVPIHSDVLGVLQGLPHRGEYVFPDQNGSRMTLYGWIRTQFEGALDKAGIRDFRFHDLRHTFASELVMRGADLKSVSELLGHSTMAMTERYSHLSPSHKALAVNLLAQEAPQPLATPKVIKELESGPKLLR